MLLGLVTEIVGYAARLEDRVDPFNQQWFIMSVALTVISDKHREYLSLPCTLDICVVSRSVPHSSPQPSTSASVTSSDFTAMCLALSHVPTKFVSLYRMWWQS